MLEKLGIILLVVSHVAAIIKVDKENKFVEVSHTDTGKDKHNTF